MQNSKVIHLHDMSKEQSDQDYTEVYVWGSNHQGQLGLGHKYAGKTYISPKSWSFNQIILQVSCGEEHSAFLTLRGQIFTMGSNLEGRLGVGDPSIKYSATPCLVEVPQRLKGLQLSCGSSHTVAVMDSGEVFSWGHGAHGALGTGSIADAWEPVRVPIEEKSFIGVRKASAGSKHTAFVTNIGTLYVCGTGETGQLGTGRREKELLPVHVNLISEKVRDVACGAFHTLILVERGRVYATGGNTLGQLGLGNKKNTNIPIRIKEFDHDKVVQIGSGHHSAALTEKGDLFIWGTGVFGEYLNPIKFSYPGIKFKDISLGAFFGVAIDEESNVWTWGSNANGELGTENNEVKGKVTHNPFFDGKKIETVSCGGSFAIGLGQTIRNRRRSPSRESPLKSRVHGTSVDAYESPQRKSHGGSRKLNDSMAISYELEEKSLHHVADKERNEGKEGLSATKKAGHLRGNSIDRTRLRNKEMGKSQVGNRKEERRDVSEGNHKEDPLVALLMKQKNILEKCLREEKQEKLTLEQSLLELKKRMIDLQEGPGGFGDLGEMVNRQAKKFDELKMMYDEETNKKERATREYQNEKQKNRELTETLIEKEERIITLQKMVDTMELRARDKHRETEEITQNLLHHNGRLKQELEHKIEDILKLQNTIEDLKSELKEKKEVINKLEESLNKELIEKRELEFEIRSLSLTLESANNNLQHTNTLLQKETSTRSQTEKDLEATKKREEELKAQIEELQKEFEHVQTDLEQNLTNEQENNAKMFTELENLNNAGTEKDSENQILKQKLEALEQDLQEHQEKNKKLINLLSNEIEKQAEQFKKKTYDALVGPASKLAQNIIRASKENGEEEYISVQNLKASNTRESIDASTIGSRQVGGNTGITWPTAGKESMFSNVMNTWQAANQGTRSHINIIGVDSPSHGDTSSFNGMGSEPLDLERLRKELYEEKSTVESRMDRFEHSPSKYDQLGKRQHIHPEKFNGEGTGSMTLSTEYFRQEDLEGTFGGDKEEAPIKPLKFMGAFMGKGNQAVEEARARLCKSANKLRDILDLPEYEKSSAMKSIAATPVKDDKKRDFTPTRGAGQKGETTPVKEDKKGQSDKKGSVQKKSPSPYKVPTFRSSIDHDSVQDPQEIHHLQNLKEVKERLEMLQRNKKVLENKMHNYESKLKHVNN